MVVSQSQNDGRFPCPHCDKSFKTNQHLNYHLNTHTGTRPHKCELCPRSFFYFQQLTHHINRHLGIKPYNCDQCDKSFVRLSELKTHKDQHTGSRPFKCPQCPKTFTQDPHLKTHIRTHSGDRPFKCDHCSKQFTQSSHLNVHKKCYHSSEKKYKCTICRAKFRLPHHLKSHLTTHSGERPYKCLQCPQAFTQVTCLTEHKRKWHGEEELPCRYCNKIFRTVLQRRAHETCHSKIKRFFCVFCDRGFCKKNEFWRHLRGSHIKERVYKCGRCEKWFISSTGRNSCERSHEEKSKLEILNVKTVRGNIPEVDENIGHDMTLQEEQVENMQEPSDLEAMEEDTETLEVPRKEVENDVAEANEEQNGVENTETEKEKQEDTNLKNNDNDAVKVEEQEGLRCKICNLEMKTMWHRNAHMRTHKANQKTPVQCKVCNLMFRHQNQLNGHMNVHKVKLEPLELKDEQNMTSPTTATSLSSFPSIRNSMKTNYRDLNNGPLYKIHTGRAVNDLVDKKKQIKRISNEELMLKPFQCRFCKKICKHRFHLNGHMRFHKADIEQERKNGIGSIKRRSLSQSPLKPTKIDKTTSDHKSPIKVVSPIKIKSEFITVVPPIKVRKHLRYKCTKCPYSTNARISLQLHVKLAHEGVVPHKCDHCWKSFPTKTKLDVHLKCVHLHT